MLGLKRERLVEFKAAYVTKCESFNNTWPEMIFYGERGTPNGMAQFTPYPNGYFQLHGMSENITLFSDGLVKSSHKSSQPNLPEKYIEKIEKSWEEEIIKARTNAAIQHLTQFIPAFDKAHVSAKPLFGAQQIPGSDASLRAANVSFEGERYARCEVVKASSVISMADAIIDTLYKENFIEVKNKNFESLNKLKEKEITAYAKKLCTMREYPQELADRINKKLC